MSTRIEERIRLGGPVVPVVVHRNGAGPTVAITANVHGDEVTGVAAVHTLDRWLSDQLGCGSVVLYPSLNPRGLEAGNRRFGDADLNRCFPGAARGTASARAAHAIWRDLMNRRPDAVVDLHADSPAAVGYALVDRAVHRKGGARRALEASAEELARASGLIWMREDVDDDYLRYHLDRSLAGALLNHGDIPSVTLEVGPRRVAQPDAVRQMVAGVRGILAQMGMTDEPTPNPALEGPWRRASTPRAERAGMFVPQLAAGSTFEAEQSLGEIRGLDGTSRAVMRAPGRGVVISWAEGAWVDAGGAVGTLALED